MPNSAGTDEKRISLELTADSDAAAFARRALVERDGSIPPTIREDVLLLMTELVTNAVRHAGVGPERSLSVEIRWRPGRVYVEVIDPGTTPFDRPGEPSSQGGFGLMLVEEIADRWGVDRTASGTTVWFELRGERKRGPQWDPSWSSTDTVTRMAVPSR